MEADLENLIDVCRQVTRWADAPTPKGEFPHSFLERLKRMLNVGSLDEAALLDALMDKAALLDALIYVANNAQKSPNDSVRDICNEAFDTFNLPLLAKWSDDLHHPISFQPKYD